MVLKDNKSFKLSSLSGGSYSGMDRLYIPHNILILKQVSQRPDNGNVELICQAADGPEEKRGGIHFLSEDRSQKDVLYSWFRQKIGKDIETIYNSDFAFGGEDL